MADHEPTQNQIDQACKVFVTNIDGNQSEQTVEYELRRLFERYGKVNKLSVKKNKNGYYHFAFVEFQLPEDAGQAIKQLDQFTLFGKRMRVRQDKQSQGCFYCKQTGHYARQCPQNKQKQQDNRNPPRQNYMPPPRDSYERHERPPYQRPREDRRYQDYRDRHHRDQRQRQRDRHGRYDDRYDSRYQRRYDDRSGDYDRHGSRYREEYGREERRHYRRSRSPSGERRRRYSRSDSGERSRRYRDQRRDGRGHRDYYPEYRREERRGSGHRQRPSPRRSASSSSFSSR